ncbi:hypothetical protein DL768_006702 [Monosporascus sp. mg162]|nr:hypothetical protein DL768_006702 [Monosporascus sp. mg162]
MYNLTKALLGTLLLALLLNPLVSTTPLAAPRPTQLPMERDAMMTASHHEKGLGRSAVYASAHDIEDTEYSTQHYHGEQHGENQHWKLCTRKRRGSLQ